MSTLSEVEDRIEILSVSLLNTQRTLVEAMHQVSQELSMVLGWHYLLDLSWAACMLQPSPAMHVIAAQGVNVLSVDRFQKFFRLF